MTEIQKFDSQPLSTEIVQFDSAAPYVNQPGIGEMLTPVLRRWYVIILLFLLVCTVGFPVIWLTVKSQYETTAAIRVSPIIQRIVYKDENSGSMPNYESFRNTECGRFSNDAILNRVADRLKQQRLGYFVNVADPIFKLRVAIRGKSIRIEPDRKSELITLTMLNENPSDAEMIINAFLESYLEIYNTEEAKGDNEKMTLLEDQRNSLLVKMDQQRDMLGQLAAEFGSDKLEPRQEMMLQQLASLQQELITVGIKRISLETRVQMQESLTGEAIIPAEMQERRNTIINSDPTILALTSESRRYENMIAEGEQIMVDNHPEMIRRKSMLKNINERIEQRRQVVTDEFDKTYKDQFERTRQRQLAEIKAELDQTTSYEKAIQDKINSIDTKTINLGRKQFAINDQQEQLDRTKEMYNDVNRRIEEIKVESQRPARVSIAYRANSVPAKSKKPIMIGAIAFGGMVAGVFLAFLLAKADKRLHHPNQIVRRIGVRIIGTTTSPKDVDRKVLGQHLSDDYQNIRANLGLLNGDGKSRILVITSPGTGDGKTTFSVNLAVSFAQSGEKVLLIDGDLRKPDIAETLRMPKGFRGIQEVLFGKPIENVVYVAPSGVHVLAADERNTVDALNLLNQPQTAEMIRQIAAGYDRVIIDTPPVLAFADALVWAKMADATILTSLVDHTSQTDLREAIERLEQIGVHVIGTVVNNVRAGHSYHRYGYGYGYGYGDQAGRRPKRRHRERLLLEMPASGKTE